MNKVKKYFDYVKNSVVAALENFKQMTFESKMGSVFLLISLMLLVMILTSCGSHSVDDSWLYKTI